MNRRCDYTPAPVPADLSDPDICARFTDDVRRHYSRDQMEMLDAQLAVRSDARTRNVKLLRNYVLDLIEFRLRCTPRFRDGSAHARMKALLARIARA